MDTWTLVLICWLAFDFLIFLWIGCDDLYYSHNLGRKFKRLKDTLTEE